MDCWLLQRLHKRSSGFDFVLPSRSFLVLLLQLVRGRHGLGLKPHGRRSLLCLLYNREDVSLVLEGKLDRRSQVLGCRLRVGVVGEAGVRAKLEKALGDL